MVGKVLVLVIVKEYHSPSEFRLRFNGVDLYAEDSTDRKVLGI